MNEFLICFYDRCVVTNIVPFEDRESLKDYIIKNFLQYPAIEDIYLWKFETIISEFNKRWNRSDGDEWRLIYRKTSDNNYILVYNDL